MAKVVRFHAFGGPDVLRVDSLNVSPPGPGEARIRVGAFGLNRVEAIYREGHFGPVQFPAKIGYEAAGVIDAVGRGVEGFAPGDRVAVLYGLSMEQYGTYGEQILYPADRLVKVEEGQTLVDAAASWMQYGTAYALVEVAQIAKDDHVAITAASSSVGLAAIQIANAHEAIPIAITRGRGKADALRSLGAAHVIVSDEEDMCARIRQITGGKGARIIFDAVGGATFAILLLAAAREGVAIVYGTLGGHMLETSLPPVMLANLTLRGWSADIQTASGDRRAPLIKYVNAGFARGAFKPVVAKTFPIEAIAAAHRYLESNAQVGKIVVTTGAANE